MTAFFKSPICFYTLVSIFSFFTIISLWINTKPTIVNYETYVSSSFLKKSSTKTPEPSQLAEEENRVRGITKCVDKNVEFKVEQRGDYFVLYNFVKASKYFACHESVTYTTQADYSFLDNVPTLIKRWDGPISVALFAPGDDFRPTVESIAYLRNCESELIKNFVTFHVFFNTKHFPTQKLQVPLIELYEDIYDCNKGPPYLNINPNGMFKRKHNLTYPINIARNIARQAASTHFVFASDIELYPTPKLIHKFLKMIKDHPEYEHRKNPRVYALPIFEVLAEESVPDTKTELQELIRDGKAFLFHRKICSPCHTVPKHKEWVATNESDHLHVFTIGKRLKWNKMWEAFYIGTQNDPLFDERLSWEGQSNKMSQGYSLCLLNYDYMVLDNAFLIHKPGVKKSKEQIEKYITLVRATNQLMKKSIKPELNAIYGYRDGCYL